MSTRDDRERRFDEQLRRAARALVTEELPRGVVDPRLGGADGAVRRRVSLPGLSTAAAAVAVLLLATAVALGPGLGGDPSTSPTASSVATPAPSPTPPPSGFKTSTGIRVAVASLRYTCSDGKPLSTIAPGPDAAVLESAICTAPEDIGPLVAAIVVQESARGEVVEVHAKADIVGSDTSTAREAVAGVVAKAAFLVVAAPDPAQAAGDWVFATLPGLEPGGSEHREADGFVLDLTRNDDGGYLLVITRS